MPPTRSRKSGTALPTRGGQSRLSFGARSRITKPAFAHSTQSTAKKHAAALEQVEEPEIVHAPTEPHSQVAGSTTADAAVESQATADKVRRATHGETSQEEAAEAMTNDQLARYWHAREAERKAPRVHQEGLSVSDKILRHFDLSSQYGPCIGIARTKRWHRADRLHLHPPIEVLAVLLKEGKAKGDVAHQKAYVDELMSSRYIIDQ
ncbi:MAG: hypothetical protein M1817_005512 [Caeruleum heppii]|nr:MAG: hypothetical protein M1817_005512 [Caeruleum heppii]